MTSKNHDQNQTKREAPNRQNEGGNRDQKAQQGQQGAEGQGLKGQNQQRPDPQRDNQKK